MLKVLIAEDMTVVGEGLVSVLARQPGIDVVAQTARGDEVLAAALAARPDVAVLDVAMPGQDGITTTRQLAERLPSCRTLILTVLDRPATSLRSPPMICPGLSTTVSPWSRGRPSPMSCATPVPPTARSP
ncbi:response regulator transcription factor [Streptomyces sp. NPDC051286]|uniref:response regulator transcription factor n=1 Tax=Streptomyces sp. NPDC051286 TaxID=3365647 RepID=UPI003794C3FA